MNRMDNGSGRQPTDPLSLRTLWGGERIRQERGVNRWPFAPLTNRSGGHLFAPGKPDALPTHPGGALRPIIISAFGARPAAPCGHVGVRRPLFGWTAMMGAWCSRSEPMTWFFTRGRPVCRGKRRLRTPAAYFLKRRPATRLLMIGPPAIPWRILTSACARPRRATGLIAPHRGTQPTPNWFWPGPPRVCLTEGW